MYIAQLTDKLLRDNLETFGAVLVEGPKWCGKSTSAARAAKSELYIADPTGGYRNKRLAELDVTSALAGERPRLIDEWQEVPPYGMPFVTNVTEPGVRLVNFSSPALRRRSA